MIKEQIGDKSMATLDFKWNKKCGSLHQYSCFESENHPSNYLTVISFILSLLKLRAAQLILVKVGNNISIYKNDMINKRL